MVPWIVVAGVIAVAVIWMTHRSGFVQGIHAARASASAEAKGYRLVGRQWVLPGRVTARRWPFGERPSTFDVSEEAVSPNRGHVKG